MLTLLQNIVKFQTIPVFPSKFFHPAIHIPPRFSITKPQTIPVFPLKLFPFSNLVHASSILNPYSSKILNHQASSNSSLTFKDSFLQFQSYFQRLFPQIVSMLFQDFQSSDNGSIHYDKFFCSPISSKLLQGSF